MEVENSSLRRDECGDPAIIGSSGHVYAIIGTLDEPVRSGFWIFVSCDTPKGWTFAKRALAFAELVNDGDEEGAFALNRFPSPVEAETIRRYASIPKKIEYSEGQLERRRQWARQSTEARQAA